VLIDGRFRVACFLATCASIKKETTVLFDDYESRTHYHLAEKLFDKIDGIDNRMAVFKIKPNMLSSFDLMNNIRYFNDFK
jgi:aminoglycoside N3'-acetyltransferase